MAQPPLSVAIRQLEQEIGTSLFNRSTREVTLTEAGAALLEGARRTLAEAEAAVGAAQRVGAGEVGSVRLAYAWSTRFDTLPALGQTFSRMLPDVELLTEEMRTYRMPSALRSGAIDIALAVLPDVVGELSYQVIRRERVVVVLSARHRLAQDEEIALEALAGELLVFPRKLAPRLHDFYVGLCRAAGFEPKLARESSRTRWTVGTWNATTAVMLPESVSNELPVGTVAVPLAEARERLHTELCWRADDRSPIVATFVELASGVFAPRRLSIR